MNTTVPVVNERNIDGQLETELNLENLIKNHIQKIGELAQELKAQREMYQDSFANNPIYREHDQRVKEATKARLSVKSQIAKQPSVAALEQKCKDLRFDIGEMKRTLSGLLIEYKQRTGATQLELFDNSVVEIVESATVVKRRSA